MRLIDAERVPYLHVDGFGTTNYAHREDIENVPTIDPVRAAGGCRCGECKHAVYRHWANKYECKKVQGLMNFSDHFCGYGEPEEFDAI